MGPETSTTTTAEHMGEDLMQAVTCLHQVMDTIKKEEKDHQVIDSLEIINNVLERCMETNKVLTDVLSGKMKCTTCGSTSVGFLSDCHDSATSTTTTVSHRSSEEPPRRKTSGGTADDDESDEVCSSIGSRSIRSVSSSVNADDDEQNQTILASDVTMKTQEEEEEEQDLVLKSILSTTSTSTETPPPEKKSRKETHEEEVETNGEFDLLLQNALGISSDSFNGMAESAGSPPELADTEEIVTDKDTTALLNNFFQLLFAQTPNPSSILESTSDGTDSTGSSQPSPPADPNNIDMAMFESLLAETMNQSDAASEAAKAAARKRKSTPMKVPKSENGAGYVCPMEGCNKIFKEKGSVHRHFVTHIGMRFNCDKCKASYTQKHALMLHQKIHANPDAYQCRGCGTNYTTQNGLRLHRQRNPACMEHNTSASMVDFNAEVLSLTKNATPTKQMVMAAP